MGSKRIKSIDIIKGIAMIMVIMVHYEQSFGICKWFHYFQMGCPMFFVASGFGIMCLINRKFEGCLKKNNVQQFYYSRFKALAPGWYAAFVIIFLSNTLSLLFFDRTLSFGQNRGVESIVCNLLFINGLLPFCNNNVMPGGWYIGTTAILYALTPLFLLVMSRFKNKKVFFVITSFTGMVIWAVFYILFKKAFINESFSYYFFLVHYPEYLLGIMLYLDLSESLLKEKQVRLCMPLGVLIFAIAYLLFYLPVPFGNIFSAWMTALATYLILYHLISKELTFNKVEKRQSLLGKILSGFGKNSYCIFLLHAFCAWTFVQFLEKILGKMGINIRNYCCFFVLIPVVLMLAYFIGYLFNKIVHSMTKIVFKDRR